MSHLRVEQIGVRFDTVEVLREATLTVAQAEVVALLGPSGSGKSTLLRVIAGILRPDSGSVWIGTDDITSLPAHQRGVGMVFQDNQLFPHMSTIDNVAYGLRVAGVGTNVALRGSTASASLASNVATSPSCPAARPSAWRWRVRWPRSRAWSCSTNHSRVSIENSTTALRPSWHSSSSNTRSPQSSSPMTRPRLTSSLRGRSAWMRLMDEIDG
jgi:ABC-type sugar transport system ATPase subunit